jgi:hypothetical protein
MDKTIKTSILSLSVQIENGDMTISSNNKPIQPIGIKMDQAGSIFVTDRIPLSAIGFKVASTKDTVTETGFEVEFEILINKELSHNQTILYIETIAKPALVRYLLDMFDLAKNTNLEVEEHKDTIEQIQFNKEL